MQEGWSFQLERALQQVLDDHEHEMEMLTAQLSEARGQLHRMADEAQRLAACVEARDAENAELRRATAAIHIPAGSPAGEADEVLEALLGKLQRLTNAIDGVDAPVETPGRATATVAHTRQITFVLEHYLAVYRALAKGTMAPVLAQQGIDIAAAQAAVERQDALARDTAAILAPRRAQRAASTNTNQPTSVPPPPPAPAPQRGRCTARSLPRGAQEVAVLMHLAHWLGAVKAVSQPTTPAKRPPVSSSSSRTPQPQPAGRGARRALAQETAESDDKDGEQGQGPIQVGDQVRFADRELRGVVRYIGAADFAPGVWYGVELAEAQGKNDGAVQGRRYFSCPDKCGVFVRASKLKPL
jgi:hypothetical protein